MLTRNIRISDLQKVLDAKFGKGSWLDWEPETILLEFKHGENVENSQDLNDLDFLLVEKIYVLQCLNKALNSVISLPEFLLWTTSICNNEHAEFEILELPTSLELAWMVEEVKKVGNIIGQPFTPSLELIDTLAYLLKLDGFSTPVSPFEFIPQTKFEPGQTEEDIKMKRQAIKVYVLHMQGTEESGNV